MTSNLHDFWGYQIQLLLMKNFKILGPYLPDTPHVRVNIVFLVEFSSYYPSLVIPICTINHLLIADEWKHKTHLLLVNMT